MATLTGLEPATSTVTGWRASDCSTGPMCLVVREGIDPPASAVSERRSHRLSYRTVVPRAGLEPGSAALKGRLTNPYRNGAWAVGAVGENRTRSLPDFTRALCQR